MYWIWKNTFNLAMKVALITNRRIDSPLALGVSKKLKGQYNAFVALGCDTDFFYSSEKGMMLNGDVIDSFDSKNILFFLPRLRFFSKLLNHASNSYDLIYIRYPLSSFSFIWFLWKLRRTSTRSRFICEIPTFPYGKEMVGFVDGFKRVIDKFFTFFLRFYLDSIVTYYGQKEIYNISTIQLTNGIEVSNYNVQSRLFSRTSLSLISVANVMDYHGFDRVIRGLANYEGNCNVMYHVVGGGKELNKLKALVVKLKLTDKVVFHGVKSGKELNQVFDLGDMGVGTLGMYRKGLNLDSSLKTREYCARGISFINACKDLVFESVEDCIFHVTNNDAPININEVVRFYYELDHDLVSRRLRKLAEEKLDWSAIFETIVNIE